MKATADQLIDDYLKRLRKELRDLPSERRRELEEEIMDHIAEARSNLPEESAAEIRTVLDRLGDPADIAAEARERFGARPYKPRGLDVLALVLLLVGGVLIPVLGWFVGALLLWISDAWSNRDKVIGTLVIPGGLLVPVGLLLFAGSSESCVTQFDRATGTATEVCNGGGSDAAQIVAIVVVAVLFVAPLVTTAYLARRMRSRAVSTAVNAVA